MIVRRALAPALRQSRIAAAANAGSSSSRDGPTSCTSISCSTSRAFSSFTSSSNSSNSQPQQQPQQTQQPQEGPILDKVLVANRGEIACRVMRTCQRLGISTVAVYSGQDGPDCAHARMADEAFRIGTGPAPADSYLLQQAVLEIAAATGARAVHPGYGFLSENAAFARACADASVKFVGPPAEAIARMGDKAQSKAVMEAAGVPTTPGFYSLDADHQDAQYLHERAVSQVGFPLLIKAVAGGGGKGMRLVESESEFRAALESCRRESQAAFGDDRVLLERYLRRPRHVEVQVVADAHGDCVHLLERDCSLQRRHQKVIEEAPAGDLPAAVRAHLGELGCRAARAVGYENAGTVEFLLDTASLRDDDRPGGGGEPDFYFCEMNTRLQVEHPVTEMVTGVDLVEWQLRIAAGEPLPLGQDEIVGRGHAFEARIYAENPARNFLPATGTVWHHRPPPATTAADPDCTVRVDTGLQAGQEVSVYYDPMISKLVAHGPDRPRALRALVRSLRSYQIAGVPTNIDFLVRCARHPTFAKGGGAVHTGFLEDHAADVRISEEEERRRTAPPLARAAGALAVLLQLERRAGGDSSSSETDKTPWSSHWGSWRMTGGAQRVLQLADSERQHEGDGDGDEAAVPSREITCTSHRDGSFDVSWNNGGGGGGGDEPKNTISYHVKGSLTADGAMEMVVNGTQRVQLTTVLRHHRGTVQVRMWPQNLPHEHYYWKLDVVDPAAPVPTTATGGAAAADAAAGRGRVRAPMPGKIARVQREVGDAVQPGDVVVVMEAMKMEHACASPLAGAVAELRCKVGDVVDDGAVLFVVQDPTAEAAAAAAAENDGGA